MVQYVFAVGELVERKIDDVWYLAKVTAVDPTRLVYSLEYMDDGNTEQHVMRDEIRGMLKRLDKSVAEEHPLNNLKDGEEETKASQGEQLSGAQVEAQGKPGPEWQTPLTAEKLQKIRDVLGNTSHPVIAASSSEDQYRIASRNRARPRRRHSFHSLRGIEAPRRGVAFYPWAGVCEQCEKMTIFRCSRCTIAFYCSRNCQRQHYKHHSDNCKLSPKALKPLYKLQYLPTDAELLGRLGTGGTTQSDNASGSTPAKPGVNKKFIPINVEKNVSFADAESATETDRRRKTDRDGMQRDEEGREMQELTSLTGKRSKPFSSEYDDPMMELSRGMKRLHVSGGQPDFITGDGDVESGGSSSLVADESLVGFVCDMLGNTVTPSQAREALELFRNDMDRAVDYLLTGPPPQEDKSDENRKQKRSFFSDSAPTTSAPSLSPAPAPSPAPSTATTATPAPASASAATGTQTSSPAERLLIFNGQHFIEKRPCNVTIYQQSRDDYTMNLEILVLDADHGEDPHTHHITVHQADLLAAIRVHESHAQDILAAGNEHERASTVLKYLGGQITTQDEKDLLHYVICTPSGRVLGLSDVPEDITAHRGKFAYGPPPDPATALLGTATTVDTAVVNMLVEMFGVDRSKAHAAAAMNNNDPDRAAEYLLTSM